MGRRRAAEDVEGQLARIRQAIMLIGDQVAAARTGAGTTIVSRADAERTLREQRAALVDAHHEIQSALQAVRRAAGEALTAGAAAAAPYERAEVGFESQLRVIEAAQAELSQLSLASAQGARRSTELLRGTLSSLHGAMREQLVLLKRLERVQRGLAIDEMRRRAAGAEPDAG